MEKPRVIYDFSGQQYVQEKTLTIGNSFKRNYPVTR